MLLGILLAFVILICIALAGVVLLQRSEGGALGMGGGPSGFMTARGAGDLLTRLTWILGSLLFAMCLLMTILQGRLNAGASVVDRLKIAPLSGDALRQPAPAPAAAPGVVPATPADDGFGAPAPTVNVAPAAAPASVPPGAVTIRPAAPASPPARPAAAGRASAAIPAAPAPTVTVAPARGAAPAQTPPGTNTGPTDPVAKTLGGVAPSNPATPEPKTTPN